MADLIKPENFTTKGIDGEEKTFVLSRIPAIQCREIVAKYPMSALPKLGDYAVNEETMLKLMAFVGVDLGGGNVQRLTTRALVDNHCTDWEMLFAVERAMLAYNTSFFKAGTVSTLFDDIGRNLKLWLTSTLTDLLAASSKTTKQP